MSPCCNRTWVQCHHSPHILVSTRVQPRRNLIEADLLKLCSSMSIVDVGKTLATPSVGKHGSEYVGGLCELTVQLGRTVLRRRWQLLSWNCPEIRPTADGGLSYISWCWEILIRESTTWTRRRRCKVWRRLWTSCWNSRCTVVENNELRSKFGSVCPFISTQSRNHWSKDGTIKCSLPLWLS